MRMQSIKETPGHLHLKTSYKTACREKKIKQKITILFIYNITLCHENVDFSVTERNGVPVRP